jgi:hypothetical protein
VPFLRVLVLAFALMHATGLSDALEVACVDECADAADCDDEGCPPICPTCECAPCPPGIPMQARVEAVAVEATPMEATFASIADVASSPDPREILHVPIALRV